MLTLIGAGGVGRLVNSISRFEISKFSLPIFKSYATTLQAVVRQETLYF